ncbi:MAG: TonB-dependent receptor [Sphingomonas sp.]|uniref:TonB-dependent receptor n=1 Tax=Sphingomonas sp. TaxID=28214 RepID=UPI00185D2E22|nr:TonB-dependent receptor [Sphingomonas sp.]
MNRFVTFGVSLSALASASIAQAQQQPSPPPKEPAAPAKATGDEETEVIVTGVRRSLQGAVAIERESNTVISTITADEAGQFADQNIAESLQRLAGVTIQRVEGEGRTIQVRGLNSNFNQVVVNGAQIGSSDPDGARSVSLDVISSDLLSGITVAKTLTPDTDQDSLGAQVNLRTLSAFDRRGTTARLRAEGGLAEYSNTISPKFGGDFTTRLANDTIGIALAGTYSRRFIQSEEIRGVTPTTVFVSPTGTVSPASPTGALPTNTAGLTRVLVPRIVDQRLKNNDRERIGATAQIDWRPSADHRFSLSVIRAQLEDRDLRRQNEWEVGQSTVRITEARTGFARYTTTRLEQQLFYQDSKDRLFAGNFIGENKFGNFTLSYGADVSKSEFTLPNALRARFATGNNLTLGVNFNEENADVAVLAGSLSPAGLAFNQVLIIDEARTDDIYAGYGNLKFDFSVGSWAASLKVGAKYRDREKIIRRGELTVNPTSGTNRPRTVAAGLPVSLEQLPPTRPANTTFSGFFLFPDPGATRTATEATAALFGLLPTGTRRDFDFREQTLAGYVQGQVDFSPAVTLIGGVRVERTRFTAAGLVVELIERDGVELPPLGGTAPQSVTREYTDFFPSIHLRADISRTIVGRLSYSRAQVRPTFEDARNFQSIDTVQVTQAGQIVTTNRELDGGNPLLSNLTANQIDATLGWYPTSRTSFTVAGFYKALNNPFISTVFRGNDVALAGLAPLNTATGIGFSQADTVGNGGSGRLLGVELGFSHLFSGPLNGFFASGNLTLIDGEARSQFVRNNAPLRLEDQAAIVSNLSAGYEDSRATFRASLTYVGDRVEGVDSTNAEFDVIRAPFYTIDINGRFNVTKSVQIYADIVNLTNQVDFRFYRGIDGAGLVNRTSNYGRTFQIGAVVNF